MLKTDPAGTLGRQADGGITARSGTAVAERLCQIRCKQVSNRVSKFLFDHHIGAADQ
jgi:hypothetical protein